MNTPCESNPEKARPLPTAIRLEGVAVHFDRITDRPSTLKEWLIRGASVGMPKQKVAALTNISFDVGRGEMFGIIGQNGAGKSTLLQVISGILRPTEGRVCVWGKITSLLALGAGFHRELSGRENIHLYSSLLGRSPRKGKVLFDGIVEFSELSNFLDAPLRTYSSGMIARLGFAVAMAERPDILLIDEVLAVGDEQFRAKCRRVFECFREAGTTILLITHRLDDVLESCSHVVWLHRGCIEGLGAAQEIVSAYRRFKREQPLAGSWITTGDKR